jgi:hypothetical protein
MTRLFSPEFQADPYPLYREMQEEGPFLPVKGFESLIATRYDDVLAILRDPRFRTGFDADFDARGGDGWAERSPTTFRLFHHMMLAANPPDHTRLRALVSKAFTPRRVLALRPRLEALVEELLDAAAGRERIDFVADFAYPLPVIVIAELLGLPPGDRDRLRAWSRPLAQILDGRTRETKLEEAEAAGLEMTAYLRAQLESHRARPGDDLIDALLAARDRGDRLSEDELLASCVLLLIAGHETTTNLVAGGALALLRHPEAWKRLRREPALVPSAVEEMLRYDGPVQFTSRKPAEDVEIAGEKIPAGREVILVIAAANRDPRRFRDPDRFDPARADNAHLAFGHGLHFCLGAALARLEAQLAFGALLRRLPHLALEPGPLHYRPGFAIRALEALPVRPGT